LNHSIRSDAFGGLTITLEQIEGAPGHLVAIAERYWQHQGFDEHGKPQWSETTTSINTDFEGPAHVVAARAVRALVKDRECDQCRNNLALTSRAAFERLCQGRAASCVDCDPSMQDHLKRAAKPGQAQRRRSQRERRAHHELEVERQRQVAQQQRVILQREFAVELTPDAALPTVDLRTNIYALAMLHHAPDESGILHPVETWVNGIHPCPDRDHLLVTEVMRADIIRIHPTTHVDAFAWTESSEEDSRAPVLGTTFYPLKVTWYVPYGASFAAAHLDAQTTLNQRLSLSALSAPEKDELADLIRQVVAGEALRYLEFHLSLLNLPTLPDHQRERSLEILLHAAGALSLAELYNLAWRSAQRAAAAAQEHQRAPRRNMTTHAVNWLEQRTLEALSPNAAALKPFQRDSRVPLAPLTRTVFESLLHLDPFTSTASLDMIGQSEDDVISAAPAVFEAPSVISCSECGTSLLPDEAWMWVDVRHALDRIKDEPTTDEGVYRFQLPLPLVSWNVAHGDCAPDDGAVFDVRLPADEKGMLDLAAELLRKRRWILQTDIANVLDEFSRRTGRFAPNARDQD
jgi:hypothetical protein